MRFLRFTCEKIRQSYKNLLNQDYNVTALPPAFSIASTAVLEKA